MSGRRIDLDVVHGDIVVGGSPSGDSAWALARGQAARQANALLDRGVAVVIAEGSFNLPAHRVDFMRQLRAADPVFVSLRVSVDKALRRAERDPTRGRSRDAGFLRAYFAGRSHVLSAAPTADIVIDTGKTSTVEAAAAILQISRATRI